MRVIGTAGHVDHGKSTLVAALTGTHPDRLKEEQQREMTIDLGFAWFTLPNGEEIGIVDVPGHRDFIENMLAGIGSIDAVLFVIAADEGVMPQTREHLAILNLLHIPGGITVLTKTDLIEDPAWLPLVEADIQQALRGSVLEKAPLLHVSARTGQGLPELITTLSACLAKSQPRPDLGRPRLSVDRVFTLPGFGTIVTGTLLEGHLQLGDEVEILPTGRRARVRSLQTHRKKVEQALPGSRTAVNLVGVEVDQIQRGNVIALPGRYEPTQRLDVQVQLLPEISTAIEHNDEVKFFLGAAECLARVRLLGSDHLHPGQTGWLQLELHSPVIAARGDRYILRRPSPSETIGGGLILDAHPAQRHKRFDPTVLTRLQSLLHGSPEDLLYQASLALGLATLDEVRARARLPADQAQAALHTLLQQGQLLQIEQTGNIFLIARPTWTTLTNQALAEVQQFHATYPLRRGIPREALKSRLKLSARSFQALLKTWLEQNILSEQGPLIYKTGFRVQFTQQQSAQVAKLLARFADTPYSPPSSKECSAELGEELFNALLEQGLLIAVSAEIVFRPSEIESMRNWGIEHLRAHGSLTVIEFRDHYQTSRRYALAFLEYLDAQGVTIREGDARRLKTA
jgi:selenocysteine-specific elongation factor